MMCIASSIGICGAFKRVKWVAGLAWELVWLLLAPIGRSTCFGDITKNISLMHSFSLRPYDTR